MPRVSEPASVAEAAEVLAGAGREGLRVSIEREGGDVVLSTRRLDRLLEHEAGDLTAVVEAGISLSALNGRLAGHGQMLALDPPGDPSVGAAVAGDLFGPRSCRYGRPRDLVLGVTVVLADGTVANSGGKVVKNVAGYDLGKLFCGSAGRLGLIARVSVRLHPLPTEARTLVVEVGDPDEAQRASRALVGSQLVPSAVDLVWGGRASRLAVLFEGGERAVEAQLERARALLGGREDGTIWEEVAELQLSSRGRRSFARGELAAVLREEPEALVRLGPTCFAYLPEPPGEAVASSSALVERIRAEFDPNGVLC